MTFIIFMNIRGLGADLKFLALKDLFSSAQPKIILIQETMQSNHVSISYFRKMFPSWYMVALEAKGLLGGWRSCGTLYGSVLKLTNALQASLSQHLSEEKIAPLIS